ncbi:MAG: sodium-translocating pyrophosphatase, partial [Crenarchaeota archaeon]|nr:sodium-translocating pyrophosphatase [Thermoproteota archaeon]
MRKIISKSWCLIAFALLLVATLPCYAGEADLVVPNLKQDPLSFNILLAGMGVCVLGMLFGLWEYFAVKKMKVHQSMLEIGELVFATCKTYLIQQGKFLIILELFLAACIAFYFGYLSQMGVGSVLLILAWSVIGILGSYLVSWYGIRMNTHANSRTAFVALRNDPISIIKLPLRVGMSIGVLLISVELILMLTILLFMPGHLAGACFIGFAIGESLGASALRVAGGIFTKIADIGSDLMKIILNIKEDDPRNPGVIADCTGDNAGDSVGPTADGFETYGVTGVALVSFILLAVGTEYQILLLTWIFTMRILMVLTSIGSYWINDVISTIRYKGVKKFNFESPLTRLIWLTSFFSIVATFFVSYWQLRALPNNMWLTLSIIVSCGTIGAAVIPELTKVFTSTQSSHTKEVVTASREGGASLTVLSGLVSGNFSGFWIGLAIVALMAIGYAANTFFPEDI